jgi:hypothetical protein
LSNYVTFPAEEDTADVEQTARDYDDAKVAEEEEGEEEEEKNEHLGRKTLE